MYLSVICELHNSVSVPMSVKNGELHLVAAMSVVMCRRGTRGEGK